MLSPEEEEYYDQTRALLEAPYLAGRNPRAQSGFSGDATKWEHARRPILQAIHRDGAFLDIGCASGHLMECLVEWAADDGYEIEPYGLELIPAIADVARARLPRWADRIHTGNVMTWEPPRRYDFVRTELVYVPRWRRRELVERLLEMFVVPGGRVIVCSYGSSRRPKPSAEPAVQILADFGFVVAGNTEAIAPTGRVTLSAAWIDAP